MKKFHVVLLGSLFVGCLMVSVTNAGFVSDMGNMVKEDTKQAATQETKKVVDKSMESARKGALNATSGQTDEAIKKAQQAQKIEEQAEETRHSVEKINETGQQEMKKWKGMFHNNE